MKYSTFAAMSIDEYIGSGIIETYCLGFTSPEENRQVEAWAVQYPEVQAEIEKIRISMLSVLQGSELKPRPSVKAAVMNTIYSQQSLIHSQFVPLMHEEKDFSRFYEAVKANQLGAPAPDFDNIVMQELPSTVEVINFAVWVKQGHEEESHNDMKEFIAILEGSCDMFVGGEKTSYSKGQIIQIPVHVPHYAVVTSSTPMFALVQRQLLFN